MIYEIKEIRNIRVVFLLLHVVLIVSKFTTVTVTVVCNHWFVVTEQWKVWLSNYTYLLCC